MAWFWILAYIVVGLVLIRLALKFLWHSHNKHWIDWTGKTVLVTGGTNGVGKSAVVELIKRGARVVFTGRDTDSVKMQMLPEVRAAAKGTELLAKVVGGVWDEDQNYTSDNFIYRRLDMSDLGAVREFALWFCAQGWSLDALVNNAGTVVPEFRKTRQGIEWTQGINHFAHHYLTVLLHEKVNSEGRIIHTSSAVSNFSKLMKLDDPIDFGSFLNCSREEFAAMRIYARSKLSNLFFSEALQAYFERHQINKKSVALHPGAVHSQLSFRAGFWGLMISYVGYLLMWATFKNNYEGAQTILHCLNVPFSQLHATGYYDECRLAKKNPLVDRKNSEAFLKKSEELLRGALGPGNQLPSLLE